MVVSWCAAADAAAGALRCSFCLLAVLLLLRVIAAVWFLCWSWVRLLLLGVIAAACSYCCMFLRLLGVTLAFVALAWCVAAARAETTLHILPGTSTTTSAATTVTATASATAAAATPTTTAKTTPDGILA